MPSIEIRLLNLLKRVRWLLAADRRADADQVVDEIERLVNILLRDRH